MRGVLPNRERDQNIGDNMLKSMDNDDKSPLCERTPDIDVYREMHERPERVISSPVDLYNFGADIKRFEAADIQLPFIIPKKNNIVAEEIAGYKGEEMYRKTTRPTTIKVIENLILRYVGDEHVDALRDWLFECTKYGWENEMLERRTRKQMFKAGNYRTHSIMQMRLPASRPVASTIVNFLEQNMYNKLVMIYKIGNILHVENIGTTNLKELSANTSACFVAFQGEAKMILDQLKKENKCKQVMHEGLKHMMLSECHKCVVLHKGMHEQQYGPSNNVNNTMAKNDETSPTTAPLGESSRTTLSDERTPWLLLVTGLVVVLVVTVLFSKYLLLPCLKWLLAWLWPRKTAVSSITATLSQWRVFTLKEWKTLAETCAQAASALFFFVVLFK